MLLHRLLFSALRLVMFAAGLVLMVLLLALGLAFALLLLVWALLRGRRPQWQFRMARPQGEAWPGFVRGTAGHTRRTNTTDANVVDIEAREVPEHPRNAGRHLP